MRCWSFDRWCGFKLTDPLVKVIEDIIDGSSVQNVCKNPDVLWSIFSPPVPAANDRQIVNIRYQWMKHIFIKRTLKVITQNLMNFTFLCPYSTKKVPQIYLNVTTEKHSPYSNKCFILLQFDKRNEVTIRF